MINDVEFTMRFAVWSSTLITAIIVGHWCYSESQYRMVTFGIVLKALGWSVHQFYWLQSWLAYSSGDVALHTAIKEYRWITMVSEAVIVGATVLILSPYLEAKVGRHYLVAGSVVVICLMASGYWLGYPE